MKIIYQYPQGYRSDMQQARESGSFNEWVDSKYGGYIRDKISGDFVMAIEDKAFTVDFTYDDDGRQFLKEVGGREISD